MTLGGLGKKTCANLNNYICAIQLMGRNFWEGSNWCLLELFNQCLSGEIGEKMQWYTQVST